MCHFLITKSGFGETVTKTQQIGFANPLCQLEDKDQSPSSFAEQSFFASECATSATEQKRLNNNVLRNSFPKDITLRAPQCDILFCRQSPA